MSESGSAHASSAKVPANGGERLEGGADLGEEALPVHPGHHALLAEDDVDAGQDEFELGRGERIVDAMIEVDFRCAA